MIKCSERIEGLKRIEYWFKKLEKTFSKLLEENKRLKKEIDYRAKLRDEFEPKHREYTAKLIKAFPENYDLNGNLIKRVSCFNDCN